MQKLSLFFSILILASCSAKLKTVTQADADRGNAKYNDVTLASLQEGKSIFVGNCGKCHGLKDPTSRTEEKWNKIVPIMVKKVNKNGKDVKITPDQESLLLKYLVTMSEAK
ncbi:MAG: hypothetical protein H6605_08105 [Flavobacteriales bacterium]|nr:hypothetical protein [Flavobacteriales bacterium]